MNRKKRELDVGTSSWKRRAEKLATLWRGYYPSRAEYPDPLTGFRLVLFQKSFREANG